MKSWLLTSKDKAEIGDVVYYKKGRDRQLSLGKVFDIDEKGDYLIETHKGETIIVPEKDVHKKYTEPKAPSWIFEPAPAKQSWLTDPDEEEIASVEMWYDRHTTSWVVQRKDSEGNQIGSADYVYTKQEAQHLKDMHEKLIKTGPGTENKRTKTKGQWLSSKYKEINKWGGSRDEVFGEVKMQVESHADNVARSIYKAVPRNADEDIVKDAADFVKGKIEKGASLKEAVDSLSDKFYDEFLEWTMKFTNA